MSMRRIVLAATLFAATAMPLNAQVYFSSVTPRGWLGIQFSSNVSSVNGARTSAVIINDVTDGSPADRAGVQAGDTLLRVNDFRASSELLGTMGSSVEPGDTVRFVVRQDGREHEIPIVVAQRPVSMTYARTIDGRGNMRAFTIDPDSVYGRARLFVDSMYATLDTTHFRSMLFSVDTVARVHMLAADSMIFNTLPGQVFQYSLLADSARGRVRALMRDSLNGAIELSAPNMSFSIDTVHLVTRGLMMGQRAFAGADLTDINDDLGEYFGTRDGVLVLRVPEGTPADRTGLEAGDVITKVDGKPVSSVKDLRETAEKLGPRVPIKLSVIRHGKPVSLELRRD